MFMVSWTGLPSFWHFFFRQLNGYFLLPAFAQDSQRHVRSFRKTAHEFGKLVWIDQDLIVQHFDDVVLLYASGLGGESCANPAIGRRAVTAMVTTDFVFIVLF